MFDDMTLEELQKLLSVNTNNPKDVMRIQQLSGLTGKSVDGIWGPQTNKAWNRFLDKNQGDISQAIADEQQYQNALAQGRTNPLVKDFTDFYNAQEEQARAQAQARQEKIAKLESQIAMVKERIERNKRALVGKSYEDVNRKLAQLDMKKIGLRLNHNNANTDPTNLWRWNQGRLDTKEANDLVKTNTKNKFENEISKWENRLFDKNMTSMEVRQEIKNLENAIQDGKNIGADVSRLEKVRQSLLDRISGRGTTAIEDWNGKFDTFMTGVNNGVYTKEEIENYAKEHEDEMSVAQYNKLLDASLKTGKKEDAKAKANLEKKAKELFQKERPNEDWEDVSETTKKKFRDRARGK